MHIPLTNSDSHCFNADLYTQITDLLHRALQHTEHPARPPWHQLVQSAPAARCPHPPPRPYVWAHPSLSEKAFESTEVVLWFSTITKTKLLRIIITSTASRYLTLITWAVVPSVDSAAIPGQSSQACFAADAIVSAYAAACIYKTNMEWEK